MNIYMDRKEFLLKFNPQRPTKGMIPLTHPELFITDKIPVKHYPEGFQASVPNHVSFKCELLLTNPLHDGLWLYTDDEKERTSFLGGFISPEDWSYCTANPYSVILSALNHGLINSHPICKNAADMDPMLQFGNKATLDDLIDVLFYLVRQYKFDPNGRTHHREDLKLYYQYLLPKGHPGESLVCVKIYVLMEVKEPAGRMPSLCTTKLWHSRWYTRKDHHINMTTSTDRASLFNVPYPNDLRVTDSGLDILDNIFQTESVFGKLNIY